MLSVTDDALRHLSDMLVDREAPDGVVVRCTIEGDSLALVPGSEEPEDIVFRLEEKAILVVAPDLAEALAGREFDVSDGGEGLCLTSLEEDEET